MAETATKSAKELVIETIENMKVVELAELVSELQERFGVSAAMAPVAAAAPAAAEAPQEEEKTSFDAVLSIIGDKKIQVIKVQVLEGTMQRSTSTETPWPFGTHCCTYR